MKIISWNCNGGLRNKLKEIDSLNADLLVIQECEDPARSTLDYENWAGKYLWKGASKNKGIGIFAKNESSIDSLDWAGTFEVKEFNSSHASLSWKSDDLELFLPFRLNNEYTILAVWTKNNQSPNFGYIGQFWKYLQIHRNDLAQPKSLIVGDFNSNVIWDQPDRWWNHSDVIEELKNIGIFSLYHHQNHQKFGKEAEPTFFLHRIPSKAYHIDYAFASKDILDLCSIEVGLQDQWLLSSDHMPLVVQFN